MNKKVLILAYDFPPYISVGALRPYSWYTDFKKHNLHPIVVTRQWSNHFKNHLDYVSPGESEQVIVEETEYGTIIKTPYFPNFSNRLLLKYGENKFKLLRKIITGLFEMLQYLFPVGTKRQLYIAADRYLSENKTDIIIATGDPFVLFKYASKLSKKYNIPWIADYRDSWTNKLFSTKNKILNNYYTYIEKNILRNVAGISTTTTLFSCNASKYKSISTIIPNGFNAHDYSKLSGPQPDSVLSIGITGTIYPWHPIEPFLKTLALYYKSNNTTRISFNFYGITSSINIHKLVKEKYPELIQHIRLYPKQSNQELISRLSKNHLFVLFNDYLFVGTKIYEYLALRKNILFCFSNDPEAIILKNKFYPHVKHNNLSFQPQIDLIQKCNAGIIIENQSHLFNVLQDAYNEYTTTGSIACNSTDIEEYSRENQNKKLAGLIHRIISPDK